LCCVWTAAITVSALTGFGSNSIVFSPYNLQFLMGVAVAHFVLKKELSKRFSVSILVASVAVFVIVGITGNIGWLDGQGTAARLLYGLPAALIVLASAQLDRHHEVKPPQFGMFLGSLSYSIYLMHLFGIALCNKLLSAVQIEPMLSGEMKVLVLAIAGLAFGILAGLFIERPLQNWFRKNPAPKTLDTRVAG